MTFIPFISQIFPQNRRGLDWARRVAGRRFEDFLGRDAFGPAHLGCGPDANCSKSVKAEYLGEDMRPNLKFKFQMDGPVLNKHDWAVCSKYGTSCNNVLR